MYPRSWWLTFALTGAVIGFVWPFLVGDADPVTEGLVKVVAWLTGIGVLYAISWWALRSRPRDYRPDGEPS